MKVLIVMHSSNVQYGAAKSLKLLLDNVEWEYDIVYPLNKFGNQLDDATVRQYSKNARQVIGLYLPFRHGAVLRPVSIQQRIADLLVLVERVRDKRKLERIIEMNKYDVVILNSLVLYPLISKKFNYVIYIREKFIGNRYEKMRVKHHLNNAYKIIYIDPAIVNLELCNDKSVAVINNPFDMSGISQYDIKKTKQLFPQIDNSKIVISLIGMIHPEKGVDFVIRAMSKVSRDDITLLVVGEYSDESYYDLCRKLSTDNVIFLGKQTDINPIYLLSDYIIRADAFFATGRTVYEGLFSGCSVIIQKDCDEDLFSIDDYSMYKDRVYSYQTRDEYSLVYLLNNLPRNKKERIEAKSNLREYISKINGFLTR